MKTLKVMLFMAVAAMPLLTSCGKDDEEKAPADPSGTYTGKIAVMSSSSPAVAELKKEGSGYSLLLKDLNLSVMVAAIEIGDVTIPDVTYANGTLSGGTPRFVDVTLPEALRGMPGVTDPEITVTVSLASGTVKGNNLTFTLNVATGIQIMSSVSVDFNGNK